MKSTSPLNKGGRKDVEIVWMDVKSIFLRIFLLPGILESWRREGRIFLGFMICGECKEDGVDLNEIWEDGEGSFEEAGEALIEDFFSSSDESEISILTRVSGSTLTRAVIGTTVESVDELRGVRRTVDAFMTDSVNPYRRYFPGKSFHILTLLSKETGCTTTEY